MIRAVVWKEVREQWLIGTALVVLGGGLLVAAATLGDEPKANAGALDLVGALGLGRLAVLMLVVTAGTVCGGALFAAEREAGTITFLEVLPGTRGALWLAKVLAGALLALLQIGAFLSLAAVLGLVTPAFGARLMVYGLLAFVWGTLGSTLARTTLGAVGIAVPTATLAAFVYLIPISLAFAPRGTSTPRLVGWALFEVLMLATPLALALGWFAAPDRARRAGAGRAASGLRVLAWLGWRQLRFPGLVLSLFALAGGLALLAPQVQPVFVWPALALVAGAVAGVTAFGDEQVHRVGAFWAEGRLPVGRVWAVKVALHGGLVLWLLALLLVPVAVRAQLEPALRYSAGRSTLAAVLHDRMFDELGSQAWKYLLVPAVYGFAAGHLCGLLFRKLVVACGVALVAGGCMAALWGPSLLAGGVKHWQVWLPALVPLVTARLVMRPWAADRLLQRGPLLRVGAGGAAAALALAAGIGFRVLEVPSGSDGDDDVVYANSLPSYDENIGGREFRAATERYVRAVERLGPGGDEVVAGRHRVRIGERLELALRVGWPANDSELAGWLDELFEEPLLPGETGWHTAAEQAAARPVGQFESLLLVNTVAATSATLDNGRRMAVTLLARGLQSQARGAPKEFWPRFATALALARSMQNGSGVLALAVGLEVERLALHAAERWLERYPAWADRQARACGVCGPDPLLRLAVRTVDGYETGEFDMRPHFLADRFVLREQMRVPGHWLVPHLTPVGGNPEQVSAEADLVGFAWAVPWERERTRRLMGLGFESGLSGREIALLSGRPGAHLLLVRNRALGDQAAAERQVRATRRALVLRLAVRAHLSEKGTVPRALADLTAGPDPYLRALPSDPYADGRSFGYRVSAGETLQGTPRGNNQVRRAEDPPLVIRPGQVVLWSVGTDGVDQGGTVVPGTPGLQDMVFLVPMPCVAPQ